MATNSKRIKEILSWYSSDSPGTLANLARLLGHGRLGGTGKLVILPVDQGFEHGPARSFAVNPPAYDPRYHFELAISAGCNAYAAPLGFLEAGAAEFAGDIPLILKLNNSDSLYGGSDPAPAVTASVGDALRLGCSAIGFTIYPASALRNEMYEQIRELGEEAKSVGLAVVIWSYPRGSDRGSARRAPDQGEAPHGPRGAGGGAQAVREGRDRDRHAARARSSRGSERVQRPQDRDLLGRCGPGPGGHAGRNPGHLGRRWFRLDHRPELLSAAADRGDRTAPRGDGHLRARVGGVRSRFGEDPP